MFLTRSVVSRCGLPCFEAPVPSERPLSVAVSARMSRTLKSTPASVCALASRGRSFAGLRLPALAQPEVLAEASTQSHDKAMPRRDTGCMPCIRHSLTLALLAFAASAFADCDRTPLPPPTAQAPHRILFVGNSFLHGHAPPVLHYNAARVADLNGSGYGGVPGVFKQLADD
eukprot:gene7068-8773_t